MSICQAIKAKRFLATSVDIEQLARAHAEARNDADFCGATYLSVLIALLQQSDEAQQDAHAVLEQLHAEFYPLIVKAVGSQSRAVFARTAKSTLAAYIDSGGDVMHIPVETSKSELRKAALERRGKESPIVIADARIAKHVQLAIAEAHRIADKNVRHAMRALLAAVQAIDAELTALEAKDAATPTQVVAHSLQRSEIRPSPH